MMFGTSSSLRELAHGGLLKSQGFLFGFDSNVPARVALYSGGLDSFAGAAQTLCDSSDSGLCLSLV